MDVLSELGRVAAVSHGKPAKAVWSNTCTWLDLATTFANLEADRGELTLDTGWSGRWTATCRYASGEVVSPVRDLDALPVAGREPVRRFSWHRSQRHRSGLEYLVSTGRHHGYESLEEARLLLMLDFAGEVTDVLSQPVRLKFFTEGGPREHTPDFLAYTRSGRWLIDVRPAGRIEARDRVAFAAAAEVALLHGWGYTVVTGWIPHVTTTVDDLSAQRRPLTDRLGMADILLAAAAAGPRSFGELTAETIAPAIARAYLLNLLWHRRLGMDLSRPLADSTLVTATASTSGGRQ
jgi:hypothetical protein